MTHTPGPWRAIRQKGKYAGNYNIGREEDCGKGPLRTFVTIYGPKDICPPQYTKDAKDNAYLIAAAPDLLAACEEIQKCLEHFYSGGEIKPEFS